MCETEETYDTEDEVAQDDGSNETSQIVVQKVNAIIQGSYAQFRRKERGELRSRSETISEIVKIIKKVVIENDYKKH